MKNAEEIKKAYEAKKEERNKAKMEVVKGAANYITETLFEDAKKGKFSPDNDAHFSVSYIERLAVNGPYGFSGHTICGEELRDILGENGIEFEQVKYGEIRVFLSK